MCIGECACLNLGSGSLIIIIRLAIVTDTTNTAHSLFERAISQAFIANTSFGGWCVYGL